MHFAVNIAESQVVSIKVTDESESDGKQMKGLIRGVKKIWKSEEGII